MKPVFLQFDQLSALTGFWQGVNDRGYIIIARDLTLQIQLTEAELQVALQQYDATLLPINRAAA